MKPAYKEQNWILFRLKRTQYEKKLFSLQALLHNWDLT